MSTMDDRIAAIPLAYLPPQIVANDGVCDVLRPTDGFMVTFDRLRTDMRSGEMTAAVVVPAWMLTLAAKSAAARKEAPDPTKSDAKEVRDACARPPRAA